MKNKLKEAEKIISGLMDIDRNNVFSDFCYPWIWTWINASEFYKKFIYGIKFSKKEILERLLKNIAKLFYYKLLYIFSKEKALFGKLKKDTELLIVNWYRNKDFFEKDPYLGTLYKELNDKKRKFQILFFPVAAHYKQGPKSEDTLFYYGGGVKLPSFFYIFKSLFKNFKFFTKYKLSFLEKIIFINCFIDTRFLRNIIFYEYLKRQFKDSNLKKILITWENQPEHKAVCLAAHEVAIKVYGYVHSSFWPDGICYAKLKNKYYQKILPDKLFVHGIGYKNILEKFGWKDELVLIKSQRYATLNKPDYFKGKLFLPYDYQEALFCAEEARKAIEKGLFKIREIQAHPAFAENYRFKQEIAKIKLDKQGKDIVVCGTTTISLEVLSNKLRIFNIAKNPEIQMFELASFQGVKVKKIGKHIFKTKFAGNPKDKFFIFEGKKMIDYL